MSSNKKILVSDLLKEEFPSVEKGSSVKETFEAFKEFKGYSDKPSIYYVYILENNKLEGIISVKDLLFSKNEMDVLDFSSKEIVSVSPNESIESVARKMAKYDYQAFPVIDSKNEMIGIIRLDDMLEILEDEASEDIFKKAGFQVDISPNQISRSNMILNSSIFDIIKIRLPWLIVALIGGLLAGEVIHVFEESLKTVIALAFFIPVIMDMGGNIGTQSSTIFVRGVTLGQISEKNILFRILKESSVGLIIGLIVGLLSAIFSYFRHSEPIISIVLIVSMTVTCFIASLVGFFIPWAAKKLGYDPAAVSDPLITTVKDITALVVYFLSAYILLGI